MQFHTLELMFDISITIFPEFTTLLAAVTDTLVSGRTFQGTGTMSCGGEEIIYSILIQAFRENFCKMIYFRAAKFHASSLRRYFRATKFPRTLVLVLFVLF